MREVTTVALIALGISNLFAMAIIHDCICAPLKDLAKAIRELKKDKL